MRVDIPASLFQANALPAGGVALVISILIAAAAPPIAASNNRVDPVIRIELLARGIIENDRVEFRDDPTSRIGAKRGAAIGMRVVNATSQIPLAPGTAYGIAFRVTQAPAATIQLKVVIESSAPCRLKSTGVLVHRHDAEIRVRVGDVRHIAARIPANDDENPCQGAPQPGMDTLSIFYEGRLLASERFMVVLPAGKK